MTCLIRKCEIVKTPEEEVRQNLLFSMLGELHYPEGLIGVEKSLKTLPHLKSLPLPDRRVDIVVFTSHREGLIPLMLIECKACKPQPEVLLQLLGYNRFIKAPWVAVASSAGIQSGNLSDGQWIFQEGLPSYEEALMKISSP